MPDVFPNAFPQSVPVQSTTPITVVSHNGGIIQVTQGDSYDSEIEWIGETEDQWPNLTDAVLRFGIRYLDYSFEKIISVTNPTGIQIIRVPLSVEETLAFPCMMTGLFDIQSSWPTEGRVKTLLRGQIRVYKSATTPPA